MMKKELMRDQAKAARQQEEQHVEDQPVKAPPARNGVGDIHRAIGNQAVQRLLAQRSAQEPAQVDDQIAGRIHRARGSGQPLEGGVQQQMGQAMGQDFGKVRAHTSREADDLSQELGAKAFTVGNDIFFRQGAYDPGSGEGQELIAHELAHVVQQGSGQVHGGPGMTLSAPGDVHEQQADATARAAASATPQRQEEEEAQPQRQEEEEAQPQVEEEEELPVQAKADGALQMQVEEEEELPVQAQEEDELQLQDEDEGEEIVATQQEEEEAAQPSFPEQNEEDIPAMRMAVQRQEELPEELV